MRLLGIKTFRHGVHPPESKDETSGLAIRQFPFAPVLIVPLVQHMGRPSIPTVQEGQEVVRGQRIAQAGRVHVRCRCTRRPRAWCAASRSSPASAGAWCRVCSSNRSRARRRRTAEGTACPLETTTPDEIIAAIQEAGVVGLGGAAFPTHVKLKIPEDKYVDTLIINGAECEPYLTTDHRVMLEQRDDLFMGIRYLLKVTGAERVIIGVEANKPDAAEHLARGPARRPAGLGRGAAREVSAGRREDADHGAARSGGALGRSAARRARACASTSRRRPRSGAAAPRPRHPGAGDHHHGPRRQAQGQLSHSRSARRCGSCWRIGGRRRQTSAASSSADR